MGRILISNLRTDEMIGPLKLVPLELRSRIAHQAYRTLWCVRPGDILILPSRPAAEFLRYLCDIIKVDIASFHIIVPPPGRLGAELLYKDRMEDKHFLNHLSSIVEKEGIDDVLPYHFERTSARVLQAIGLAERVPGFDFIAQGGSEIINSKAVFRVLAAGAGVPIAEGATVRSLSEAKTVIWELLSCYQSLILKQDLEVAGLGNEIMSMRRDLHPVGALKVVLISNREQLSHYLCNRWEWLTQQGSRNLVVERYYPDSLPLYVEMTILDNGTRLDGYGEMRMTPILNGHIVPGYSSRDEEFEELTRHSNRLCDVLHAMGYRGPLSIDAIVTPEDRLVINEVNCRQGGPTHIHELGRKLFGTDYLTEAVLSEDRKKTFPPLSEFVARLACEGICYDPASKEGVVVTLDDVGPGRGFGEYCIIARNRRKIKEIEGKVARILAHKT